LQSKTTKVQRFFDVYVAVFQHLLKGYRIFRILPRALMPVPVGVIEKEIFGFQNLVAIRNIGPGQK
jgi:hypothetical protein